MYEAVERHSHSIALVCVNFYRMRLLIVSEFELSV